MRSPHIAMLLDETPCKRPCVTLRRIQQGDPRLRPTQSRHLSQEKAGGLPVLSVTTRPSCRILRNGSDLQQRLILDVTRSSPNTVYNVYNSAATCRMEKVFFPGVKSYREIIAPSRSSGSCFSSKKSRKVAILDPCFQDTKSRDVTMVWVPNTQQKPPKTEDRGKPLKVWIKDLSLTDPLGGMKREKQNPILTINKKQKKPPTGGGPLNVTLVGSSSLPPTKLCMATRDIQEQREEASKFRRRLFDHSPDADSITSPSLSGIIVENRRVVLHDTREKGPLMAHTGPVYRMDEQQSAAPNNMEIDLDRIRNQYYLWKKYIHLAGPSHRIKPPDHKRSKTRRSHKSMASNQLGNLGLFPYDRDSALTYYKSPAMGTPTGSVVCDTRSRDSESANHPSLAGFSQRSWTDEEPSKTLAEMDASNETQQEIPEEKNKEAQPRKRTEAGDTPPELPELEQKAFPEDEESTRANILPGPPESAAENTDVHEQRRSSPQPNPPPPSPM